MNTATWIFGAGLVLVVTAGGCGNTVTVQTGGAGGTASTGDVQPSATSSTGTGTGGACAGFADQKGQHAVTVRFVNQGGIPIFLPSNCSDVAYTLEPTNGGGATTYHFEQSCLQTCADLETQPPFACGACAPRSYRLDPGTTKEVVWDGTGLLQRMMPATCFAQPSGDLACGQIVDAQSDTYRVGLTGFSECGPGCQCDAQGVCNGDATGAQALPNPTQFSFPQDSVVEVVFGPCAFPCPGG
jgi:hypothetical protein